MWNFCIGTQLSEVVKEIIYFMQLYLPTIIPHKRTKLKKSKMCEKCS